MKDSRPVNLDLTTVRFPITAIASISHRICGVISWVGLGFFLLLSSMNVSAFGNGFLAFISWGFLSAFGYYCLATLKHIVQDLGYFEDFEGGKMVSWAAIIGGVAISVILGVMI